MANLGNFRAYINTDCKGDKIKLPESASQHLLSMANISYPLCFELSVPISREEVLNAMQNGLSKPERNCIHCGVLDFTASEGCICLPLWIMQNLNISESSVLSVANITLPKGRYVRLQPHTLLKDIKTKQKLESSLRNFTTLTANTTITIEAMQDLKLNVLEVKPNKAELNSIQIIDCDLIVEFEAALDGSTNDIGHFERNLILNKDQKEDIITHRVKKGEYSFCTLEFMSSGIETIDCIKIKATPQHAINNEHDVDLYASWTHNEPGTTGTNYDYHCVDSGAVELIINIDNDNTSKHLYITVHGFDADACTEHKANEDQNDTVIEYTLSVTDISLSGMEIKELHRASSLVQHDDNVPISDDPDKSFCGNCHRFVNKWSYDRHYSHCVKQFHFCISCKQVIKMDEVDAHNKTFHRDLKCKMCQEVISGGKQTLISHRKYECLNRPVNCEYCHLPFPFIEYEQHQVMCGSRTEICVHCNQYISLSLIQQHSIDVHGVDYETPLGMARMKSDEVLDDLDVSSAMNLGGFGAPQRDYDGMNDGDDDNTRKTIHERWICSSCDYNNRPNHMECKICKTKRTKYMKTVSEVHMDNAANKRTQNTNETDKIGGNLQNIPQRDYDNMLSNTNEEMMGFEASIKPPLIEYYDKHKGKDDKKREDVVIASGVDPSMIPQRDYDKMLNATDMEIPVQSSPQNNAITDVTDVPMHDIGDDDVDSNMKLSRNIDNIPDRDYEQMLNQPNIEYDEAMEEQRLIEQITTETESNININQYRSETAVIPQRNYDKMLKNNEDIMPKDDVNEDIVMTTSSSVKSGARGYWLCPSTECDHLNKATRNNCSVCHTLKPSYRRTAELMDDSVDQLGLEHRWVCKNCDGLNKGSRNKCVYCKEAKQYEPNSKSAAQRVIESTKKKKKHGIFDDAERWVCPNKECNFLNKGSRLKCQVCHSERSDQHILWGDRAKHSAHDNDDMDGNNDDVDNDEDKNKKKTSDTHPLEARARIMESNAEQRSNTQWQCPMCTFINAQSQCEMCGCPKDAQ